MSTRTRAAMLLLTSVLLVGCGSDSLDGPNAGELASDLGCEGATEESDSKTSCEFNDSFLGITTYDTKDALDADVDAASAVTVVLVGDNFMIDAPDAATLEAARDVVGGEIVGG